MNQTHKLIFHLLFLGCQRCSLTSGRKRCFLFLGLLLHVLTSPPGSSSNTSRDLPEVSLFYLSLSEVS